MSERLTQDFFARPTLTVAQELLGTTLVFGSFEGIITETEAYMGQDDPACHAARGKTQRNAVMFGPAGISYVYFIYGMYHCLNVVTEAEGFPAAVLIRGVRLQKPSSLLLDGPGKLCRHLKITRTHSGIDLTRDPSFSIKAATAPPPAFDATPRIGIRQGTEKLWRFIVR